MDEALFEIRSNSKLDAVQRAVDTPEARGGCWGFRPPCHRLCSLSAQSSDARLRVLAARKSFRARRIDAGGRAAKPIEEARAATRPLKSFHQGEAYSKLVDEVDRQTPGKLA